MTVPAPGTTPTGEPGLPATADVLVIGAGPAGATAALAARRADPQAHVVLVDRAAFPRDKSCGDGIAPFTLDVLAELGVDRDGLVAGSAPIPAIRLRAPRGSETVGRGARPDWVVPRRVFDARIVAAAVDAGADLRRHAVRAVTTGAGGVTVDGCRARCVVAADGANSTVRRALGLRTNPDRALAIAVRGYAPTPAGWEGELRIDMVEAGYPGYAWHFPIGDGRSNVGFGLLRSELPAGEPRYLHRLLAELLPEAEADPATLRAHHLPLSTVRPRQPDGRVLLAGDAASLINPLTGEGIFYAVLSGRLAGEAALLPDPGRAYRARLREELGRHLRHTRALAVLARRPALVDAAVRAGGRSDRLFERMVDLGLGRGLIPVGLLGRVLADRVLRRPLSGH